MWEVFDYLDVDMLWLENGLVSCKRRVCCGYREKRLVLNGIVKGYV